MWSLNFLQKHFPGVERLNNLKIFVGCGGIEYFRKRPCVGRTNISENHFLFERLNISEDLFSVVKEVDISEKHLPGVER